MIKRRKKKRSKREKWRKRRRTSKERKASTYINTSSEYTRTARTVCLKGVSALAILLQFRLPPKRIQTGLLKYLCSFVPGVACD